MKSAFRNIAIAALATSVAGWFLPWSEALSIGPRAQGWTLIPVALVVSLLSAIAWAVTPPRSDRSLGWAVGLIVLTLCAAGWYVFVMTHLGIQ